MPTINIPVVYNQQDNRWAQILLGFNTQLPYNFYNFACLICCLAMLARYYGKDFDPPKINESFKSMGADKAFGRGTGNYVHGGFNKLFGDISERNIKTPSLLTDAQIGEIKSSIDMGHPVMIQLDVNPRTVEADQHFVLIIGYDPNDENNFTIADPIGGKIRSVKDYLGWFRPNVRKTIEQYSLFVGPKPQLTDEMIPIKKEHFELYTRNHDKWHQIVNYLGMGTDPNTTPFEAVQRVIAGIKSSVTDLQNRLKSAEGELATKDTEITNRKEQVSRLETELLNSERIYKARLDAQNASMPDTEKMQRQYEGEISRLRGDLDAAMKRVGNLEIELSVAKNEQKDYSEAKSLIQRLMELAVKIFKRPS